MLTFSKSFKHALEPIINILDTNFQVHINYQFRNLTYLVILTKSVYFRLVKLPFLPKQNKFRKILKHIVRTDRVTQQTFSPIFSFLTLTVSEKATPRYTDKKPTWKRELLNCTVYLKQDKLNIKNTRIVKHIQSYDFNQKLAKAPAVIPKILHCAPVWL